MKVDDVNYSFQNPDYTGYDWQENNLFLLITPDNPDGYEFEVESIDIIYRTGGLKQASWHQDGKGMYLITLDWEDLSSFYGLKVCGESPGTGDTLGYYHEDCVPIAPDFSVGLRSYMPWILSFTTSAIDGLMYDGNEALLTFPDLGIASIFDIVEKNPYAMNKTVTERMFSKVNPSTGMLDLKYQVFPNRKQYPSYYVENNVSIDMSALVNKVLGSPTFSACGDEKNRELFGNDLVILEGDYFEVTLVDGEETANTATVTIGDMTEIVTVDKKGTIQSPKAGTYTPRAKGLTTIGGVQYEALDETTSDPVTVVSYSGIDVYNLTASRLNKAEKTTTITFDCPVPELIYEGEEYNSLKSMKYRYRNVDSSTWSDWSTSGIVKGANDQYTITMDFEIAESYMFEVYVEDEVQSTTESVQILQGKPLFSQSEKGYFVVGGFPDDNYSDCKLQVLDSGAYVKDKVIVGDSTIKGVKDNLTTSSGGSYVLDAYQGKVLNDKITTINSNLTDISDKLPNLIQRKIKSQSYTVSGNSIYTNNSITPDTVDGYTPVFAYIRGTGSRWVYPYFCDVIGSGKIQIEMKNTGSSSVSSTVNINVIYLRDF